MNQPVKIKVPVILGPTAAGKTGLCVQLAQEFGSEILSCDSRQIYKYMNIGTAKPSQEELDKTQHWLIDIVEPSESYSAFRFARDALKIIRDRATQGRRVCICGGTGFYFQSLQKGLASSASAHEEFRERCSKKAEAEGRESLHRELQDTDPHTAARLHPNDLTRIIRALEIFHQTGMPLSAQVTAAHPPDDIEFCVMVVNVERDVLYKRIDRRVDSMMREGLAEEFQSLRNRGYVFSSPGMCCVGYKELFAVENGRITLSEAVEKIKQHTRNYAKRQITWFRHKIDGTWFDLSDPQAASEMKKRITSFIIADS
jgi:tRNA dimethylallyltransferase